MASAACRAWKDGAAAASSGHDGILRGKHQIEGLKVIELCLGDGALAGKHNAARCVTATAN